MINQPALAHRCSKRRGKAGLFISLLLGASVLPAPLYAQEVPPAAPEPNAAQEANGDQLVEIVVTAQRREQNLQDTPVAVSAFSSAALTASGVTNVREIAQLEPSINVPAVAGVYLPFLRGIGNSAAGTVGNEASVATYIDDMYYSRLSTAYLQLGSIDRVEVLKGPQGTLFGRNSSGGAIQMFTKDPGSSAELNATIGYANYDTISGQLYASAPVTDTLAWNISVGASDQRDGWGRSITTGEDAFLGKHVTVRSKLVWEPGSQTRVKLVGFYAYSKSDIGFTAERHSGSYGSSANWAKLGRPFPPGYPNPPIRLPSLADVPGDNFYNTRLNFQPFQREEGYGASLRIDQELGFADIVSISGFRNSKGVGRYDADYTAQNFFFGDLNSIDRQITQELQIKSKRGSTIDWILGAFYFHSKSGFSPIVIRGDLIDALIAPGASQNIYGVQTIDSYSVFGQATAPIGDKTNLTLGLRYTRDDVSGRGRTTATVPGAGERAISPVFEDAKSFERVTWKGAIDHHINDDLMAYASISRGFKAGTYNTFPLDTAPARPEIVDSYEIGLKSELFDRRVRLNGALFWNDIKNPQLLVVINRGLTVGQGLANAEKARVRGGEFGLEALPASGLTLRAAATYLDGKYLKFTNAPFYALNGVTLVGPVPGDASGNRLPQVPKWRFNAGFNYAAETGAGRLVADAGVAYTGRFTWNADNRIFEKAVALVNASLNLTPSSADWMTIGVWGKNLGNVKYYSVSQESSGPAGDIGGDIASPAAPRTYGASLSFRF